jgi:four helix bundle protein
MGFKNFQDIIAWQKAQDLAVDIYQEFGKLKDYGFKDQICRAVVSISSNIAEGFDRSTDKEFKNFLLYSRGSCAEVKSLLKLAPRLKLCGQEKAENLYLKAEEIGKILGGLIIHYQKKIKTDNPKKS